MNSPWQQGNDIHQLMQKIFAQDAEVSFEFTQAARRGESRETRPPDTNASRVCDLWARVFTGRRLVFGAAPSVVSLHSGSEQKYEATKMSDGERAAFYLTCAVIDAPPGILVIDEPDTYLHPVLMRQLWDELELVRPDCRFIYITHDMGLALSRRDAQFLVAKADGKHVLMPIGQTVPKEVIEEIIGALTLSVTAKVLVFCESTHDGPDFQLYRSWFNDPGQGVMPCGTSQQVVQSVRVTREGALFQGGYVYGIVDGDEWDASATEKFQEMGILVMPVNEVESLFCVEGVFRAVAKYLGLNANEIDKKFDDLRERVEHNTTQVVVTRYALQRLKRALRGKLSALLDAVTPNPDRQAVLEAIESAVQNTNWEFRPLDMFEKEVIAVENALKGSWDESLRYLQGKDILGVAASTLELGKARYMGIVLSGLAGELGSVLQNAVVEELAKYLPSRNLGMAQVATS